MVELLLAGGPFMFATLAVSIVTIAIGIVRTVYLWRAGRGSALQAQVMTLLEEQKVGQALRAVADSATPLAKVMRAAIMRANRSEKEIRRAVEVVATEEIPRVRGSVVYLPQLSNLATLLGLIGTIHGLIIAFQGAGSENAAVRQEVLSRGIAIAFYNTFFGLTVATIGVVLYLMLLARTNALLGAMERGVVNVVDALLSGRDQQRKSA